VNAIVFLLPVALLLSATFVTLFVLSARRGQFDDLDDPPERMLWD
jgi:cbb3-type cytochrome oxidase maturation protein